MAGGRISGAVKAGGLLAAAALAVSFAYTPATLPQMPLCWFSRLTGMACGGCGLTRAVCSISHGDWRAAWEFNPFSFACYGVLWLIAALPLIEYASPGAAGRILRSRPAAIAGGALIVGITLLGISRIHGAG